MSLDLGLALAFAVLLVLSTMPVSLVRADSSISVPASISLTTAPRTLPADGGSYASVFVALTDSSGLPTLALNATTVFLSSSQTSVGSVLNSTVVIAPGKSFAVAYLRTTATPGQTTITASSAGLKSSNAAVATATPTGYPSAIAVSAVPEQIVPLSQYRGILIVQLQDSTGLPARAVSDMQVRLLSSNVNVLNVSGSVSISSGNFSSTTSFFTGFVPGQALVTATSPGFATGSTSVSVQGAAALGLKLYAQPDKVVNCSPPAAAPCTGRLVVALIDQNGNPARASSSLTVQLRTSNLSVLQIPLTAVIAQGDISAIVTYGTTSISGNAVVTASAPSLRSDTAQITTAASSTLSPVALKLFVGPNPVLADHRSYSSVVVSLLDSKGNPTVNASGPTSVTITSSLAATGSFSSLGLTISTGQNFASTSFTSTFLVGTTTVTASAQNMVPAFANLGTAGAVPSGLIVTPLTQSIPADGGQHPAIEISLQDSFGKPAVAPSDLPVFVSSAVSQVVQFNSPLIVPAGRSAVLVNATTTTVTGLANITVYATLQSSGPTLAKPVSLNTVTPAPSSIVAFAVPGKFVLSRAQIGSELVVQLQDSKGNPARARLDTPFTVTSSTSGVFNRTIGSKIAQGDDLVFIPLVPRDVGTTQFTVSSSGLASGTTDFTVLATPIQASLSPSLSAILLDQTDLVQLSVTFDGKGLAGANVTWQATGGSVTPTLSKTDSNGATSVVFTPSVTGVAKVTAFVIHPALVGENLTSQIIVTPLPQAERQASLIDVVLTQVPYIHVPFVAFALVALAVLLIFVIRRRRRVEEVVDEGYEGAAGA